MDQFMNEMAIWNGMNTAFISNAIFFAACSFLIWVDLDLQAESITMVMLIYLAKSLQLFLLINSCLYSNYYGSRPKYSLWICKCI